MKPYPKYKDSGIDWIGKIPEHWTFTQIKRGLTLLTDYDANGSFSSIKNNVNRVEAKLEKYSWLVRATDLENKRQKNLESQDVVWVDKSTHDFLRKSYLNGGELLVAKRGEIGKVYLMPDVDYPATLGPNMYLARLDRSILIPKYSFFFFSIPIGREQLEIRNKSTTLGALYKDDFKDILIFYPTIEEQTTIANFLDHKTAQIDQSIEKQRALIELLREHRAAIINEAVTKGLPAEARVKAGIDPNVPMKDSGIEWIGEIPAHWEIWKVSRAFEKISSGATPKSGDPRYHENGTINWINTGDLNDGLLESCKKKITPNALEDYSALKIYPANSLIVAMYGATIGKTSITTFDATTNQACCVLAESNVFDIWFAFYWFLANKQHVINMSVGGGQPNISQEIIKSLKIPTPSIKEQQQIVQYIETETSRIDQEIAATQKEIELLEEYRQALIAEAVTGKIDVRDYVLD